MLRIRRAVVDLGQELRSPNHHYQQNSWTEFRGRDNSRSMVISPFIPYSEFVVFDKPRKREVFSPIWGRMPIVEPNLIVEPFPQR